MIFCFDMDGTITRHPDSLGAIMKALKKDGHTVYILTGSLGESSDEQLEQYREKQSKEMGLEKNVHFDDIAICVSPSFEGVAKLKGQFCKSHNVNWVLDDMPLYIQHIKNESPETATMGVI